MLFLFFQNGNSISKLHITIQFFNCLGCHAKLLFQFATLHQSPLSAYFALSPHEDELQLQLQLPMSFEYPWNLVLGFAIAFGFRFEFLIS